MKKTCLALALISTQVLASPVPDDENVSLMLEGQKEIKNLSEMSRMGLLEKTTGLDLWSGSYWPLYQGSLGVRYRDPEFMDLMKKGAQYKKFKELRDLLPLYSYAGKESLLSPSEKYDLLIGDDGMSLTRYSWETGEKNALDGNVKTWRGICDGWSSAAQMMPRPKKTVTLKSPTGTPITFYPEDIKALGSLMYARSQGPVIMLGKRCRNQVLGLFTGACRETNPGAFHKAIINRVGKMRKSFIADVSPGGQVWNYPVSSYKVTYYNVFDQEESFDFNKVKEPFNKKAHFSKKSSRAKETAYIVGVKLLVKYRDMRDANLLETDDQSSDKDLEMTYVYDLELDRNNNILGGESFSKNLPDFIWMPNDSTYPLSDVEEENLPRSLVEESRMSSAKGQPLAKIVKTLFELSK